MTPFTHTPVAPEVPATAAHSYQRWFTGTSGARAVSPEHARYACEAQIYRDGGTNVAEVRLRVNHGASRVGFEMALEPAALRELAQRLLDAAYDIEVNPATTGAEATPMNHTECNETTETNPTADGRTE